MSALARARWYVLRAAGALALAAALGLAACALAVRYGSLVDPARFARPDDALTVLDRHGSALRHARSHGADRRWVPLASISPTLIAAVLAAEDSRFRAHHGVDLRAVARAVVQLVTPGAPRSGASTITQQLVKRVYGRPHGVLSKGAEILRALALEQAFTKDEILEQYLNRLPFGDGIEGVARASEEYLGKPPGALTVAEAALLAGIPRAPSATEPRRHLAHAIARRGVVLARMLAVRAIDPAAYTLARGERPVLRDAPARPYEAARFVDAAITAWHAGALERDGGALRTSLDLPLQRRVEEILQGTVERFARRGARNAAGVVLANATGEVLAYVGAAREGEGAAGGQLDLLTARRQPGSTLKPFVYELLFERGGTAATVLDDVSQPAMRGARGESFEARDYDGQERGPVRARVALASSLNLAALDAARRVGADAIVARLRALGITGLRAPERYGAAVVLGGASVSPLELARAYSTLARGGSAVAVSLAPVLHPPVGTPVLRAASVRVTADVLTDTRARSDAFGAALTELSDGHAFALKTGTSAGWRDAWAAVFDESVTAVVWVGDPDGAPMASVSGFEAAAPAAVRLLAAAHRARVELASASSTAPALEAAEVCAWTGLRAGPRCRHVVRERFTAGTVPRERCAAHDADGAYVLPARLHAWAERAHPAGVTLADASAPLAPRRDDDALPGVLEPRAGARWMLDPGRAAPVIALRGAVHGVEASDLAWEVDGVPLAEARWVATVGHHAVVAVRGARRSAPALVDVVALAER